MDRLWDWQMESMLSSVRSNPTLSKVCVFQSTEISNVSICQLDTTNLNLAVC